MKRKPMTRAETHAYHLTKLAKMKRLDAYAAERREDPYHYAGLILLALAFAAYGLFVV